MQKQEKRAYSRWTPEQVEQLITYMNLVKGQRTSWVTVAKILNKTPRQCYDQWLSLCRKRKQGNPLQKLFQRAFETPSINTLDSTEQCVAETNGVELALAQLMCAMQ